MSNEEYMQKWFWVPKEKKETWIKKKEKEALTQIQLAFDMQYVVTSPCTTVVELIKTLNDKTL